MALASYHRSMDERESLAGLAAADAHLGRRVPLPTAALPLPRWTEVVACGEHAVSVEWNLDATRGGAPGRLALYAGLTPPPGRGLTDSEPIGPYAYRSLALDEAEPELRPVQELAWEADGLHLRLTGQGSWTRDELVAIAASIA